MKVIAFHLLWKEFVFFQKRNPCHIKMLLLFCNACMGSAMIMLSLKISSVILLPPLPTTLPVLRHLCCILHELRFCFSCKIDSL